MFEMGQRQSDAAFRGPQAGLEMILLFLWNSGLVWTWFGSGVEALILRRPVWYISTPHTWSQARDTCRSVYNGDLLTVSSWSELLPLDLSRTFRAHCSEMHFFYCSGPVLPPVFVAQTKTRSDAEDFCENAGLRISTFPSKSSPQWPGSPFYKPQDLPVWIGLHGDGGSWRWSDGSEADYRKWSPDLSAPPDASSGSCASTSSLSRFMSAQSCSEFLPFLCSSHDVVLVLDLFRWEEAVEVCDSLPLPGSFRLLQQEYHLQHMDKIKNVLQFSTTTKVWVGQRYLGGSWFWSHGGAVSQSECPQSDLHCGALVNSQSGAIEPCDCSLRLNVLCSREL
uniref:C-type lectin domain-containing protein n=1 Tax=Knipowitschia caucasica TaxID=637954 RepID=A0AAV2LRY6_KNICA